MVERLAWPGSPHEVVHRHALDLDAHHCFLLGIADGFHLAAGGSAVQFVDHSGRSDDNRAVFPQLIDHGAIQMIGVGVRDDDQVGLRNARKVSLAPGIDVNPFPLELQHHAAVIQRPQAQLASGRMDNIDLRVGGIGAQKYRKSQEPDGNGYRTRCAMHACCILVHETNSSSPSDRVQYTFIHLNSNRTLEPSGNCEICRWISPRKETYSYKSATYALLGLPLSANTTGVLKPTH